MGNKIFNTAVKILVVLEGIALVLIVIAIIKES